MSSTPTLSSSCNGASGCPQIEFPGASATIDGVRGNVAANPSWFGSLITNKSDGSGMQYMRNRYYDPATGKFTQQDPIGLAGGMNLYGFAGGDPVNLSDPFGLSPCCVDLAVGMQVVQLTSTARMWETATMFGTAGLATRATAASNVVSRLGKPGSLLGKFTGQANPVKPNNTGNLQPYSSETGQYLEYSANPGLGPNPIRYFSLGVSQGIAENAANGAVDLPTPITKAQELGQGVGKVIGAIIEAVKK